ncbi:hypothetical protein FHQ18_00425 [Deferribacter autotrophicus]|uniref:Uncharacterized protein n=1 Tax=Deferribacter autotrophicus TaxID=500465 RepID=A0A5A8F5H2_9BACT|nr:hypothetical protein [Deferribacter autotrophicus]KAA0259376.1 hypothetical protein FHQ18_00425 [Deferribacter autotrophicus]
MCVHYLETIGHHTCEKDGTKEKVLKNAPFLSEYNEDDNKTPFLGTGYYFWDNNIEMARLWGKWHYKNGYYIIEAKLILKKPDFFDLVGNRADMIYFRKLIKILEKKFRDKKWTVGKAIEFLKRLNNKCNGIFPFKVIRAVNDSDRIRRLKRGKEKYNFSNKDYIFLDPRIMICFVEKNDDIILNKKLIEER